MLQQRMPNGPAMLQWGLPDKLLRFISMQFLKDGGWLFLIPGFIGLFVAGFVSDFPIVRDSQLPIVYVSITFISAIIPLLVAHLVLRRQGKTKTFDALTRWPAFIASVFASSIVVGLLFGILHTTDGLSHGLRHLFGKDLMPVVSHSELVRELFSRSYSGGFPDGRPYFRSKTRSLYARVAFNEDKKIYEGVVEHLYGGETRPQVFLSPACRIDKAVAIPVQGPGVWLDMANVEDIQFIDDVCSICAAKLEIVAGKTPPDICDY